MTLEAIETFLWWSTGINFLLLLISFVAMIFLGDLAYRIHSKWFPMSKEIFTIITYSWLGFYKILIFVFNLVPLIAIRLMAT